LRPSFSEELIVPEGYELPPGQQGVRITTNSVDEQYFDTIGTPIVSGRGFTPDDRAAALPTAVVNDTFAATFWPGQDPLGKRLRLGASGPWLQVVGVVRTAKYLKLTERPMPYVFLPLDQHRLSRLTLLVHTAGDPRSAAGPVRDVVRSLDAMLPVGNVRSLRSFYEDGPLGVQRLILQLVASMGVLGLCLAIVGVYAVVSYSVRRRMREFGVRMSIGARRRDIVRLVMREGLVLAALGILIGLALSVPVARALGAAMAGVGRVGPLTLVVVPLGLTAVILAACLGPAWHASRTDPTTVLRLE
jgi:predicted permease